MFLEIKLVSFSNQCSLICRFQSGSKHMRPCQESQMISLGPEAIKRFSSSASVSIKFQLLINVEMVKKCGKFRFITQKLVIYPANKY